MTLSHSPSEEIQEPVSSEEKLTSEAQARVDATVNAALRILESTPGMKEELQSMFDKMVQQNIRDPEKIQKIQDGLFASHTERIKDMNPEQKKIANNNFTKFIENFSQNIAYMNRDIRWSNELRLVKEAYEQKTNSIQNQYASIIHNEHPTA